MRHDGKTKSDKGSRVVGKRTQTRITLTACRLNHASQEACAKTLTSIRLFDHE